MKIRQSSRFIASRLPVIVFFRKIKMAFETEFNFVMPRGYVDQNGTLHREEVMRLTNAADEILPLRDPKVQQNPGYLR